MKIFGVPMSPGSRPEWWELTFGEWRLVVMPAVTKTSGFWWAVETLTGSTTIVSNYRPTPELAAKAIEEWLEGVRARVVRLQLQGKAGSV